MADLTVTITETATAFGAVADGTGGEDVSDVQTVSLTGITSILHYKGIITETGSTFPFLNHTFTTDKMTGTGGRAGLDAAKYIRITNLTTTTVDEPYIIFTIKGIDTSGLATTSYLCLHENESFIMMKKSSGVNAMFLATTSGRSPLTMSSSAGNCYISDIYMQGASYDNNYIEVFVACTTGNTAN
tara:strand:+ start:3675 stop:4232 length:558 start_codon:yes stop_codon:yes gene_type:complete